MKTSQEKREKEERERVVQPGPADDDFSKSNAHTFGHPLRCASCSLRLIVNMFILFRNYSFFVGYCHLCVHNCH
jgi:hypothetical protein